MKQSVLERIPKLDIAVSEHSFGVCGTDLVCQSHETHMKKIFFSRTLQGLSIYSPLAVIRSVH